MSPSLALPDRFRDATFETYDVQTPSQHEALRIAQELVAETRRSLSWLEWGRTLLGASKDGRPQGLYLVGPAGTGKTHLLAAMYHALTPEVSCGFLHSSTLFRRTDPPEDVANELASQISVCCIDEVEIDDPANEMRLVKVMNTLAARDVLLLATSNVEPEQYLSRQFRSSRFHRFLDREFRAQYRIVPVHGADYRRNEDVQPPGDGWIGPEDWTRRAMERAYAEAEGDARWWSFEELRRKTTEVAHSQLIDQLCSLDHLFVSSISIQDTDDALRVLRVIDAFYLTADAPVLHFSAERAPSAWFDPSRYSGVARAVAEKFDRTVSRIHALCRLYPMGTRHSDEAAPPPVEQADASGLAPDDG